MSKEIADALRSAHAAGQFLVDVKGLMRSWRDSVTGKGGDPQGRDKASKKLRLYYDKKSAFRSKIGKYRQLVKSMGITIDFDPILDEIERDSGALPSPWPLRGFANEPKK